MDQLGAYGLDEQALETVLGRITRLAAETKENVLLELGDPQDKPPTDKHVRAGNCWLIPRKEGSANRSETLSIYRVSDDRLAAERLAERTTELDLDLPDVGYETLTVWIVEDPEDGDRCYWTMSELAEKEGVTPAVIALMNAQGLETDAAKVDDYHFGCEVPYLEVGEYETCVLPATLVEAGRRAVVRWALHGDENVNVANPLDAFWDAMCEAQSALGESEEVEPTDDLKQLLTDCRHALQKKKGAQSAGKLAGRLKAWLNE